MSVFEIKNRDFFSKFEKKSKSRFCDQIAASTRRSCAMKNTSDRYHITSRQLAAVQTRPTTDVWWDAVGCIHWRPMV